MNSARVILIGLLFFVPTISLAAPLYQPGETLNPACLPSNADCTVATSTASYFTATSTTATSTFPNLSLTNLLLGSDYVTDITGTGLSVVNGALTASGGEFATTSASYWINNVGNIGIGTSSPYTKLSVVGDIVATAITATSTFNTSGTTGGYKIDGNLILQASSTNFSTLVGRSAGAALLSDGLYNTALGFEALKVATSSDSNTAVGYRALYANTTGATNTANGSYSLYANTTGIANTANGYVSLYSNTTGSNNSANGYASLYLNTTGSQNTASGVASLYSNTTGSNNSANGYFSLYYNTTGNQNIAYGRGSLQANTTGSNNTATGYSSLYSNSTGAQNTASGMYSLYYATTSTYSTAVGYLSGVGSALTANDYNTSIDTNVTFLGALASRDSNVASTTALTNSTAIGYNAKVGGSNMLVLGNAANVGIGTSTPSSKLTITAPTPAITTHQMLTLYSNDAMAANIGGTIGFGGNYTTGGALAGWASIGGLKENGTTGDLSGYLQFATRSAAGTNAEVMRISSTGNVGIGTTSPLAKLDVLNTAGGSTNLFSIASSTSGAGTTTAMFVASNGRVMINPNGTAAPIAHLAVNGTGLIGSANQVSYDIGAGRIAVGSSLYSYGSICSSNSSATCNGTAGVVIGASNTTAYTNITSSGNNFFGGLMGIGTTSPLAKLDVLNTAGGSTALFSIASSTSGAATSTALYVAANGNVAIGTTTANSKLQIAGDVAAAPSSSVYGQLEVTGNDRTKRLSMGFNTTSNYAFIQSLITGNNYYDLVLNPNGASAGNVGISTTTPYAKLSVTNTGTGPSFIVEDSSSADATPFIVDASGLVGIGTVPTTFAKLEVSDSATTNSYGVSVIKTQSNTVAYQSGINSTFTSNQTSGAFSGINSGIYGQMFIGGSNTQNWTGAQTGESSGGAVAILGHVEGRSGWSGTVSNAASFLASNEFSSTGGGVVTNLSGFRVMDSIGTLAPVNQYGVYINALAKGSTSDYGLYFGGAQDSGSIGSAASTHISLMPGTSANVGIGTTSPLAKLDVLNTAGGSTALFSIASSTSGAGTSTAFYVAANGNALFSNGTAAAPALSFIGDTDTGFFKEAANRLAFSAGGSTATYFDATSIQAPSGTAAGPGYKFASDNTMGMYRIAVSTLGFSTASTERLRIDSVGNVGIGTTTPNQLLQIASTDAQFVLTDTDAAVGGKHATIRSSAGRMAFGYRNDALSSLTEALSIMSTDLVGVGTSSPSSKLSLTQSANTSAGGLWIAETGNTDFRSAYMDTSGILSFYGGDTAGALNTATLNAAGAWTNASDKSYKENVVDLVTKYGLATVLKTQPRFYEMKGTHLPQVGFIAQELNELVPEVVDGKDGSMGISYGNLVAVAFQAIKELNTKVENIFKSLFVKELHIEEKLCVEEVCINKDQLKALLLKAGGEEKPKENNDKPKDETPKPQETATTTATSTPEVVVPTPVATTTPEVIKEEPNEEVKPQETASTTPETVVEEPKKEEEKPVENPVEETPKVEEPVKTEDPKVEEEKKEELVKEEPKETVTTNEIQP